MLGFRREGVKSTLVTRSSNFATRVRSLEIISLLLALSISALPASASTASVLEPFLGSEIFIFFLKSFEIVFQ